MPVQGFHFDGNVMLSNLIRSDIQALKAYAVADVPADFIKLDAMELPYRFPEEMQRELAAKLAAAPMNLYPNVASCGLQGLLREAFDIPGQAEIALGNGSDELIQLLTLLLAKPGAVMLALEPSFVMYRHNAGLFGMEYVGVPLNPDFSMNLAAVLEAVRTHQPAVIFLAYPNNPTGVMFERAQVEAVLDAAPGVVVVDEAYGSFSGDSFLPLAGRSKNLVVMRTLSKIGFAGLRMGYACGHPALMGELAKIVPPYNMNQLSLAAAAYALQHRDWVEEKVSLLKQERVRVAQALAALPNTEVFASEANFITIRVPDAQAVFDALKADKILVKKLHGAHPLLEQCLRLTIGTPEQNDRVLAVLRRVQSL